MANQIDFAARKIAVPRRAAAWASLLYPLAIVVVSLGVRFDQGGGLNSFGSAFLAAMMFLTAVPTAWLFTIDFIEAGRFTIVVFGLVTSLPLWYLAGGALAGNARSWAHWVGRYVVLIVTWSFIHIALLAVIGSLAS